MRSELFRLFHSSAAKGHHYDCAALAQRLLNTLDSIGRLTGQLRAAGIIVNNVNNVSSNSGPTIIANDPSIIKMQSTIIRALSPYPEARSAVIEALRNLEGHNIRPNGHALPAPIEIEGHVNG
jgi:hypothetical protein